MRLRRIRVWLFLFIPILSCDTSKDFENVFINYFIRYYGEDGNQEAKDLIVNEDGTMLLLGNTSVPGISTRIILIKVDAEGSIIWEKKFGEGIDKRGRLIEENAQDIEATVNGNFLVLSNMLRGKDIATNEDLFDFKVIEVNAEGTILRSFEFDNNSDRRDWKNQFAKSITPLSNGGFAITGNSANENLYNDKNLTNDVEDVFAIAFKNDFTVEWTTVELDSMAGSSAEHVGAGIKIFEGSGNEFYMFGYSDAAINATDESNFNAYRITNNGLINRIVESSGDNLRNEVLGFACKVPNELGGGFYEFGTSSTTTTPVTGNLYFTRRSNTLTTIASGVITVGDGSFTAVAATPSLFLDGFILLANQKTNAGTTMRLMKVNLESEEVWSANFGAFDRDSGGAGLHELPDGRIVMFGTIELETQKKMALIKVNPNGELLN